MGARYSKDLDNKTSWSPTETDKIINKNSSFVAQPVPDNYTTEGLFKRVTSIANAEQPTTTNDIAVKENQSSDKATQPEKSNPESPENSTNPTKPAESTPTQDPQQHIQQLDDGNE